MGYDQPRDYTKRRIAEVESLRAQRRWEKQCWWEKWTDRTKEGAFWAFMILMISVIGLLGWSMVEDYRAHRAREEAKVLILKQEQQKWGSSNGNYDVDCGDGTVKRCRQNADGSWIVTWTVK